MKLIAQLQLKPTPEQAAALENTLKTANAACDFLSALAWEHQEFGKFGLQTLGYRVVKDRFELTAQVVIRCIAKVADAYKLDKKVQRTFKPVGSIAYDDRILRYKLSQGTVSIWTVEGRLEIPFVCGDRQRKLLETRQGESDLALLKGQWFLLATCEVEEPETHSGGGVIGVDFGIVELATTSAGKSYAGEQVKVVRRRTREHRRRLQKKGTRSAKRRLKKCAKKQERFVCNTNHCISKELVRDARASKKALGLEDLIGIRQRARLNKEMRWQMGNWAFFQLREFVTYKSRLAGVAVICVNPALTSRTCSVCGCCEKGNRKSQQHFKCLACGHTANADSNASINISRRAAVNRPPVAAPLGLVTSPRL